MFEPCPKIDGKTCTFATTSNYNVATKKVGEEYFTYCGIATGIDNRVMEMPKCWKKMTKYEQSKLKKGTYWGGTR